MTSANLRTVAPATVTAKRGSATAHHDDSELAVRRGSVGCPRPLPQRTVHSAERRARPCCVARSQATASGSLPPDRAGATPALALSSTSGMASPSQAPRSSRSGRTPTTHGQSAPSAVPRRLRRRGSSGASPKRTGRRRVGARGWRSREAPPGRRRSDRCVGHAGALRPPVRRPAAALPRPVM
jgi:hypothetical protein